MVNGLHLLQFPSFSFCLAFVTFACLFVTCLIQRPLPTPHLDLHATQTHTYTQPEQCSLPKQTGDCSEKHARWHFSETEKRCLPFYYTGCGGNKNSFPSLESCETHCPRQVGKPINVVATVVAFNVQRVTPKESAQLTPCSSVFS